MDGNALLKLPLPPRVGPPLLPPTDADKLHTDALREYVDANAPLGDAAARRQQTNALKLLVQLFTSWAASPVHPFVSGSFRLGIGGPDADIDVVFVTTRAVTRAAVFQTFVPLLHARADVQDLQAVPNARVPLIGMRLAGQEFDIMTCHVNADTLPPPAAMLASYEWLNGVDPASVLTFNGPRVTEVLLQSTPRANQYLLAVRALRLWAKRRGVYSNKAGYLGGINIALMVLYVAQRAPDALASTLVTRAFDAFANLRRFGRQTPMRLDEAVADRLCPVWLQEHEWRPRSTETLVMLTPCFPRSNSTYAASAFTAGVMEREFARARGVPFDAACFPLDIFATCKRFLRLRVTTPCTPAGKLWQGYIEAQTRFLVQYLSQQELAVAEFRYVPEWFRSPGVADTYITAEPDNIIRTYTVRGTISEPLQYFMAQHADAGPRRPTGADVSLAFVPCDDLPEELRARQRVISSSPVLLPIVVEAAHDTLPDKHEEEQLTATLPVRFMRDLLSEAPKPPEFHSQQHSRIAVRVQAQAAKVQLPPVVRLCMQGGQIYPKHYDVYVGHARTGRGWQLTSSPFAGPPGMTCAASLTAYETWLRRRVAQDAAFAAAVRGLRTKSLACWCAPFPCRADILHKVADELPAPGRKRPRS